MIVSRRRVGPVLVAATLAVAALAGAGRAVAEENAGAGLLRRAAASIDWRAAGGAFLVEGTGTVRGTGNELLDASFLLLANADGSRRLEVVIGGALTVEGEAGGTRWATGVADVPATPHWRLDWALAVADRAAEAATRPLSLQRRSRGGREVVVVASPALPDTPHDFEIEPTAPAIVAERTGDVRVEFAGWVEVGTLRLPAVVRMREDDREVLRLEISGSPARRPFAAEAFRAAAGGPSWTRCPAANPAALLGEAASPLLPRRVTVHVRIGPDGVPTDAGVIVSGGEANDRAALAAIGRLRWRPAACPGGPVPAASLVTFDPRGGAPRDQAFTEVFAPCACEQQTRP